MMNKIKDFFKKSEVKTGIWAVVCSVLIMIFISSFSSWIQSHKERKFSVYEEQLELKYQGTKCNLVDEVQRYIDSVAPGSCLRGIVVVNKCLEYDVDICFVLAQGQKESHFGTQGLARKTNSVWNVFAYDGHSFEKIHKDGKYGSPDESVDPYLRLLKQKYLKNKTEYDLLDEYVNATGNRYASDENYEAALTAIFSRIKKETMIDLYAQQLKKYDILLNH